MKEVIDDIEKNEVDEDGNKHKIKYGTLIDDGDEVKEIKWIKQILYFSSFENN